MDLEYEVDDGYMGAARPQRLVMCDWELRDWAEKLAEGWSSLEDFELELYDQAQEDMMQKISATISKSHIQEIVEYAKSLLGKETS